MNILNFSGEKEIADNCRTCGMCRIDFLGTGKCHAAEEHVNFAHHPHGRLKIFKNLLEGKLPLTTETEKVVESCTLCGACSIQCFFHMEMAPAEAHEAKRALVKEMKKDEPVKVWQSDEVLDQLAEIVGREFAFNDPTILSAYSTFSSMITEEVTPAYVALPENAEQTAKIVKLANERGIACLPVSSGTNSSFMIKEDVVLIDMGRMKNLQINKEELWAQVGAGIIAFDLQKAAMEQNLRFSIGESAAGVCANLVTTGIHSFFGYKRGMMADSYIEAEIVTHEGEIRMMSAADAPEITTSPKDFYKPDLPFICTQVKVKLYPVEQDETVVFIPFRHLDQALSVTRDMAEKEIGSGMGLLGIDVLSSFMSITQEDTESFLDVAQYYLKINYATLMLQTPKDLKQLQDTYPDLTLVDRQSIKKIIQGIPAITGPESMALIEDVMDEDQPYDHLFGDMLEYFLKQIEVSSSEVKELFSHLDSQQLSQAISRDYYREEYSDPLYWFNYRMFSPRFLRTHWFFSSMFFTDPEKTETVAKLIQCHEEIGERFNLEHAFCYLLPLDGGKRFFFEYEYFADQRNPEEMERLKKALWMVSHETNKMIRKGEGVYPVMNTLFNGYKKREHYLYPAEHCSEALPKKGLSAKEPTDKEPFDKELCSKEKVVS